MKSSVSVYTFNNILFLGVLGLSILIVLLGFLHEHPTENLFYYVFGFLICLFLIGDHYLYDSKLVIKYWRVFLGITTLIEVVPLFLVDNLRPSTLIPIVLIIPFWFIPKHTLEKLLSKYKLSNLKLSKEQVSPKKFILFVICLSLLYLIFAYDLVSGLVHPEYSKPGPNYLFNQAVERQDVDICYKITDMKIKAKCLFNFSITINEDTNCHFREDAIGACYALCDLNFFNFTDPSFNERVNTEERIEENLKEKDGIYHLSAGTSGKYCDLFIRLTSEYPGQEGIDYCEAFCLSNATVS